MSCQLLFLSLQTAVLGIHGHTMTMVMLLPTWYRTKPKASLFLSTHNTVAVLDSTFFPAVTELCN